MSTHCALSAVLGSASEFRAKVTKSLIFSLLLPFVVFFIGGQVVTAPEAHAVADCTASQFEIDAKHNSTFYFDDSRGSTIESNYLQFKITNKTGSNANGYFAKIENFSSSPKIGIATYENAAQPFLKNLANNEFVNLYWYLTATAKTTGTTTFDVTIYSGTPSDATAVCKLQKSITKVDSTISANANKLTSVVYSTLPTANEDGSATFTATVKGQTGTIGQGPTGTYDVNLSPATTSTFNARKFRLSGTSYRCGTGTPVLNQLYIPNACSGAYTAVFTYQYLTSSSTSGASERLSPIMQISSGTQMKHTSTPSFTIAAIGATQPPAVTTYPATNLGQTPRTSPTSASGTLNGSIDFGDFSSIYFCYKISSTAPTFTNDCTSTSGSATKSSDVTPVSGFASLNITGLTPGAKYYFEIIGLATGGSTYARGGVETFTATPLDTTTAANNITQTTATLNGSQSGILPENVDLANSYFYFGTIDRTSIGHMNQSVDTSTALSAISVTNAAFTANISGLTASTTYYFEIVIADASGATYLGGIQSFTTLAPGAAATYTISYNANGGTGTTPSSSTQASAGDTLTVSTRIDLTREGFTFGGWNKSDDGTGTNYNENDRLIPTSDFTLYVNWVANRYRYNANTGTGGPTDQVYEGSTLQAISNSFGAPSGYEFDGWCTAQLAVGTTTCAGSDTKYSPSGNLPIPNNSVVTLYAIWKTQPPAPAPTPVYVYIPHPPTITNISAPEVCAVGSQLTLTGTYLAGASATVDGVAASVLSSSNASMLISLPSRSVGTKTIVVTNVDGTASTTVKYKFVDSPVYVNYIYPETFKDRDFSYTFTAINAEKYSIIGKMPAGLTLNPLTGEISGAPTVEGDFLFTIVASNFCDETYLNVYMFVDRAIPTTFTCSVAFNVPRSDNITDIKLSQLKTCLGKITTLTPKYIEPIIYLSGGVPAGLSPQEALVHPRYLKIIDFIKSIGLDYQIYVGAFGGTTESVQINVYWPTT